jgi:hypothetical protein
VKSPEEEFTAEIAENAEMNLSLSLSLSLCDLRVLCGEVLLFRKEELTTEITEMNQS